MADYRDIGYIEGGEEIKQLVNTNRFSQVYQATHRGDGLRFPYFHRSFISFSYGGKYIEDFGIIAVSDGDRNQRNLYGNFDDNVTDYEAYDGQIYWSTHFKNNEINFKLSTDGMTEQELTEFKKWFKPGVIRELILAEHPNRGILARIDQTPVFSFIPFEHTETKNIGGRPYQVKTTLYKGDITLHFIMDDPFWYAKSNFLYYTDGTNIDYDKWIDANGIPVYLLGDPDAIKIIVEDGVVSSSAVKDNDVMFGDNITLDTEHSGKTKIGANDYDTGAADIADSDYDYDSGRVGPLFINASDQGIDFPAGEANSKYFYYGGDAPAYPIIKFTLTPIVEQNGYISSPINSFCSQGEKKSNSFYIEALERKQFDFSTPSIWTGYNQAIDIFTNVGEDVSWVEVKNLIRDNVKHFAPRAFASNVVNQVKGSTITTTAALLSQCIERMKLFLYDLNNNILAIDLIINNKTGDVTAKEKYRDIDDSVKILEEKAGDMVKSNYLKIEEKNYFDEEGYVTKWTPSNNSTSHRMYHDVINGLTNFSIQYKFMYL